jgi:hypothetical protein
MGLWRTVHLFRRELAPVDEICLVTGIGALAAALAGLIANQLLGEVFPAAGMAFVGMFYVALGFFRVPSAGPQIETTAAATRTERFDS